MYQIKIYANDYLESTHLGSNEQETLETAYKLIGTNGVRVAHIFKDGTDHGLYIARCTDLRTASLRDLVGYLRTMVWTLNNDRAGSFRA